MRQEAYELSLLAGKDSFMTGLTSLLEQKQAESVARQDSAIYLHLIFTMMDKDIARFMQYAPVVQSRVQYNPRHIQEGIALAFMQKRQLPPQGMVSQFMLQQMNEFARIYSTNQQAPELAKFKNTLWYYLMVGK
jgi:hypothetical protein